MAAKFITNANGKIKEIDAETQSGPQLFSQDVNRLLTRETIKELIPNLFHSLWDEFINHFKVDKVISTALPFVVKDGFCWVLKVSGKRTDDGSLQLVLRHQPEVFAPILVSQKANDSAPEKSEEPEELQLLSTIDMVVFKVAMIPNPVTKWLESAHNLLQAGGFFPSDFRTRFVAIKYEDDGTNSLKLIHSYLDDLIYLPLDRLIFMQKMEILFGLPAKVRPSFLFVQEEPMDIEIAKLVRMEKLSDVGCAICNPVSLPVGIGVRIKFRLSQTSNFTTVLGRCHKSIPHPEKPGQYLVYFYFFALDPENLKDIKRYMNQIPRFKPLHNEDNSKFEFNSQNLFLTEEEKSIKQIVVLDPNSSSSDNIAGIITDGLQQVKVATENSYYLFLKDYLRDPSLQSEKESNAEGGDIQLVKPMDLYASEVTWVISSESRNLVEVRTKPKDQSALLGHSANEIFNSNHGWLNLFQGQDNENLLDETLKVLASSERKLTRKFALTASDGKGKWAEISFSPLSHPKGQILVTLSHLQNLEWVNPKNHLLKNLDLLIINNDLIPDNVDSWIEGIQALASGVGICSANRPMNILIISDTTTRMASIQKKYRNAKISALLFKPLDVKSLLFQTSILCRSPFTKYNFENQNFAETNFEAHLTKEVRLDGISEFGSSITHPSKIEPGTVLFLHEGIFEKAPESALAARFYHSEPHPSQKGMFTCSFAYYGINDAFLKFCRTWIRDNYAAKKAKEA
ncbi:MAG: hypothetical protein IPJ71_05560 [Bdellovibrionales bacterium]|nr:hypothetical protein [Bdellovibrionales bacterium]